MSHLVSFEGVTVLQLETGYGARLHACQRPKVVIDVFQLDSIKGDCGKVIFNLQRLDGVDVQVGQFLAFLFSSRSAHSVDSCRNGGNVP